MCVSSTCELTPSLHVKFIQIFMKNSHFYSKKSTNIQPYPHTSTCYINKFTKSKIHIIYAFLRSSQTTGDIFFKLNQNLIKLLKLNCSELVRHKKLCSVRRQQKLSHSFNEFHFFFHHSNHIFMHVCLSTYEGFEKHVRVCE